MRLLPADLPGCGSHYDSRPNCHAQSCPDVRAQSCSYVHALPCPELHTYSCPELHDHTGADLNAHACPRLHAHACPELRAHAVHCNTLHCCAVHCDAISCADADGFASVIVHACADSAAGELHGRCVVQLGCVLTHLRWRHFLSHARRAEADSRLWSGVP